VEPGNDLSASRVAWSLQALLAESLVECAELLSSKAGWTEPEVNAESGWFGSGRSAEPGSVDTWSFLLAATDAGLLDPLLDVVGLLESDSYCLRRTILGGPGTIFGGSPGFIRSRSTAGGRESVLPSICCVMGGTEVALSFVHFGGSTLPFMDCAFGGTELPLSFVGCAFGGAESAYSFVGCASGEVEVVLSFTG